MGSNKQVFKFSKIVGRVSRESQNIFMRGQTNKFLNKFFCPESRESQNVSNGVEQTSLQFFKNCRSSKSRKSKFGRERRDITKRERTIQFLIF